MQENSRSSVQSPDRLFTECLSDAMASDTDSANQLRKDHDGSFEADKEMVVALRDIVSNRISSRLAEDSDFDPIKFPLTNQVFGKKLN